MPMPRRRRLAPSVFFGGRRGRGSRRDRDKDRDSERSLSPEQDPCSTNVRCSYAREDGDVEDCEEAVPALRFRREAYHGMEGSRELLGRAADEEEGEQRTGRRWWKKRESKADGRMRRMWEKQQQAMGEQRMRQTRASMIYAKRQILESTSTTDLLDRADNLIEEDWLGKIEEMPGTMYVIGAFGDLTDISSQPSMAWTLESLKNRARLFGCIVVCLIQIIGPPAIFFSTVCGWGVRRDKFYMWNHWKILDLDLHNCLYDWRHVKLTKSLGILFQLCFILNGLFVVLDNKQAFFKIYNIFQYLKRNTQNFDMRGHRFLYMGAFVDCWTVLWCCVSSYVIVGASNSPKDILFDSLGLLFVYNLDDISGDLGFVNEDDWPGLRLGWIHAEMVKKDWSPGDEEEPGEEMQPSPVSGDGGGGEGEVEQEYVGGERTDWELGGWVSLYWYYFTSVALCFMVVVLPVLAVFTPFLKIVPDD